MNRLSGDQNIELEKAPAAVSSCDWPVSNECTQSRDVASTPTNASIRPFGDSAKAGPMPTWSGAVTAKCTGGGSGGVCSRKWTNANDAAATRLTRATVDRIQNGRRLATASAI